MLEGYSTYFQDDTIINMYAVASTERIKEMSEFESKYMWWSGDYISYSNTYTVLNGVFSEEYIEYEDIKRIIAHEQTHAILKKGLLDTGLTKNYLYGYGINEALTTMMVNGDEGYNDQEIIATILGTIIGFDNLFKFYLNSDLEGLKNELNRYTSEEETEKFISDMDSLVFLGYYETFVKRNNIEYDEDKAWNKLLEMMSSIQGYLTKCFEGKYQCKLEESKFGRLLLKSDLFLADDFDFFEESFCTIRLGEPGKINLNFYREASIDCENCFGGFTQLKKQYVVSYEELNQLDSDILIKEVDEYFEKEILKAEKEHCSEDGNDHDR